MGTSVGDDLLYGLLLLLSVFTQVLVLFIIFLISGFIVEKARFFLIGFFWKKKGFDAVAKAVFGFFYLFMFTALIDTLFILLIQWKAPSILSATAVQLNVVLLMLIVAISYVVDVFIRPYISTINPQITAPSVLDVVVKKKEDDEYVLYFNGSRVRKFETKDELIHFFQDIKDYLGSDIYKEVLHVLNKD